MVLDFAFEDKTLHIVNVYHRTHNDLHHNLLHLFVSHFDLLIPTILIGDFNMHSHIWSFPHSTVSPWATEPVDWFNDQGLKLLNPPCVTMWSSGRADQQPSVLNLVLINEAAAISRQISPLTISQ